MKIRSTIQAPAAPVPIINREAHYMVSNPGHREFCYSSPALIISSANKSKGVNKYLNLTSAGNCKIQTCDLQDEIQNVQTRKYVFGTSVTMKSGAN